MQVLNRFCGVGADLRVYPPPLREHTELALSLPKGVRPCANKL
jgi:hypothetical protein